MYIPDHTNQCNTNLVWHVAGLQIEEPITVLTNFGMTASCWLIGFVLFRNWRQHQVTILYRYFFIIMGLATLLGGIFGHGLCSQIGISWKLPGWILSMVAVMLAERASIFRCGYLMRPRILSAFIYMNFLEWIFLTTVTILSLNFFFVEFHAFYGFVFVVGAFETWHLIRTGNRVSRLLLISVCISFLAAMSFIQQWNISPYFNATDLAHTIMIINSWFLYHTIRQFRPNIYEA